MSVEVPANGVETVHSAFAAVENREARLPEVLHTGPDSWVGALEENLQGALGPGDLEDEFETEGQGELALEEVDFGDQALAENLNELWEF